MSIYLPSGSRELRHYAKQTGNNPHPINQISCLLTVGVGPTAFNLLGTFSVIVKLCLIFAKVRLKL